MVTLIKSRIVKILIAIMCVGIIPTTAFTQAVSASSIIKVTSIRIDSEYWDKTTATLKFKATVYPENATNKTVVWTSSNPSVIKIDNTGKAVMVGKGKAILTCKATDGSGVTKSVESTNDYIP